MVVDFITIVGIPVVRGVAGWLEKALVDGRIDNFEFKKLGETVLRISVPAFALYYGFNLPSGYAVAIPFVADYVYHYVNKILKKAKK